MPCPVGYYCLEGTTDPQPCDSGLVISVPGASSKNNCTLCPAGFICDNNSTKPEPCFAGYYCPFGVDMTPCPTGTFSNVTGAVDDTVCEACTPGYWCAQTATTTPEQYPCPVGHYCPLGTGGAPNITSPMEPVPCPSGRYRDQVGGIDVMDCFECPAGFYCPNATTVCFNCTDAAVTGAYVFAIDVEICFILLHGGIFRKNNVPKISMYILIKNFSLLR